MLERYQRPLSDQDRGILERYRQNGIGTIRFDARFTFLGGAAGLLIGFLWLGIFHWGDHGASFWPIVGLVAAGAAVGFPFDHLRARKQRLEREAAAAAKWNPVIAVGTVEHLVAEASAAVRIDDNEANTAWFLQVAEKQILCVWDWVDDATEHVEVDLVPGSSPTPLNIAWTGKKLAPLRPKRKFKRGEREPEQCEILAGSLEDLDALLREGRPAKRKPKAEKPTTSAAKLADDVQPLGFYKYVAADQVSEVKAEIMSGAYDWYVAAGRAFDADAERLAEGGVKDLLDYLRPALKVKGLDLGEISESYDVDRGYIVRIGAEQHMMWGEGEGKKSWELTTARALGLINQWLTKAGSQERLHVLNGGEDAIFVLLTPDMQQAIAKSGVFRDHDVPEAGATPPPARARGDDSAR
jgi:hypothetical protein